MKSMIMRTESMMEMMVQRNEDEKAMMMCNV